MYTGMTARQQRRVARRLRARQPANQADRATTPAPARPNPRPCRLPRDRSSRCRYNATVSAAAQHRRQAHVLPVAQGQRRASSRCTPSSTCSSTRSSERAPRLADAQNDLHRRARQRRPGRRWTRRRSPKAADPARRSTGASRGHPKPSSSTATRVYYFKLAG